MPNFQIVSRALHGNKRWLRNTSYAFAQNESVLPLALGELSKAVMSFPIAFVQQQTAYVPAAVMGLQPNRNHFVAADGRWIHGYIPASCRTYPFRLFNAPDGQQVLCIDEDSGLISDGAEGDAFFDEGGEPAAAVREILAVLNRCAGGLKAAATACETLNRHALIKPWSVTLKTETGEKRLAGLFKVDETAFNTLSADALLELRDSGALLMATCQLLSMQHLPLLGELAVAHAKLDQKAAEAAKAIVKNGELSIDFLKSGDSLDFGGFR